MIYTMEVIKINEEGWREGEKAREKEEGREVVETNKHPGQDYDEGLLASLSLRGSKHNI